MPRGDGTGPRGQRPGLAGGEWAAPVRAQVPVGLQVPILRP